MKCTWHRMATALAAASCVALVTACGSGSSSSTGTSGSASSCKPAHQVHTVKSGALSVAVYSYPPYGYQEGNNLAGVDGELVNRIAAMECLKVTAVPGAASSMIPDIQSGRADTAIGDWYRTIPRSKIVLQSDPVYKDELVLVSKNGSVGTVAQLKGQKVGSVLGFLWDDDLKTLLGNDVKLYPTDQAAYADLKAGRIQVVVDTPGAAVFELKTENMSGYKYKVAPPDPAVSATVHPGQSSFSVSKNNSGLNRAFNDDLAKLRADGTIAKVLVSKGFPAAAAKPGPPRLLEG